MTAKTAKEETLMLTPISLTDPHLQYTGRVDPSAPGGPLFTWVCSSVRFILRGKKAVIRLRNDHAYYQNSIGIVMNGFEGRIPLINGEQEIDLSRFLIDEINDVLLYKRMDGCHRYCLLSLSAEGELLPPPPLPDRRIEIYGDSVSCGELCEAMHLVGQDDPAGHDGIYSNSWYSYGWQTARALGAAVHVCAQGGIALQPERGWFNDPYVGMLEVWDKLNYNESLGPRTPWDHSRFIPHAVVIALGQNDSHPGDFMAEDPNGAQAEQWKQDYLRFLSLLKGVYPKALFVLTTTLLCHHPAWDEALSDITERAGGAENRVYHLHYRRAGIATPGHPRVSEQSEMARELTAFLASFGKSLWQE